MLTTELQKNIDEKWDACWPLCLLKPIAILDLISYLFFLKKISENNLTNERPGNKPDTGFSHSKEKERIENGIINNLEAEGIHTIFSAEKGSVDLIKNYARSLAFGQFVKGGLLVTPTQKLLANAVDIIKIIEDEVDNTKAEIFEYLLNKKELNGPNGQAYLPKYLASLIVSIIQPNEKDIIMDPSVGNAGLLIGCAEYIAAKNPELNHPDSRKLVGLESDLTSLRIAGMNMILHRINNPELKAMDTFAGLGSITIDQPTVIVANLIFSANEGNLVVEGASIKKATRKEILYLNFIIKNSNPGTLIAVIVPDIILSNNGTEFVTIRQEIMDRFKVEAVISLNDRTTPQFFGTSILIFFKEAAAITDKVWFYKIEHCKEEVNNENIISEDNTQNNTTGILKQPDELTVILNHFRNKDTIEESTNPDSFYIDAESIRSKNYILSYNDLNLFIGQEKTIQLSETSSEEKRVAISNLKNQPLFPAAEKLPEPKKSYLKKILITTFLSIVVLGIGFVAYWFLYLKKDFFIQKKHSAKSTAVIDSATSVTTPDTVNLISTNNKSKTSDNTNSINNTKGINNKYTVVSDKAYFYLSPDTTKRREFYINNLVDAVLTPEKEKNGFVYVVYTNKLGQSTRGWLNKKDLKPLP